MQIKLSSIEIIKYHLTFCNEETLESIGSASGQVIIKHAHEIKVTYKHNYSHNCAAVSAGQSIVIP